MRKVDSVFLFWDCVPSNLCSNSFQISLPEDSELLFEAQWLCQQMVMDDRTCADHLTAGGMLFTLNHSDTAIVLPLGKETPSPVPSKIYFCCLQTVGSQFSTFSCNFVFQCFSKWFWQRHWLEMQSWNSPMKPLTPVWKIISEVYMGA